MKECISLHVGQAGCALGSVYWQLYCLEHDLDPQGLPSPGPQSGPKGQAASFFRETDGGRHVPRCLMVDLEPTTLDEIRVGPYRGLFDSRLLVSGKEDAANNFALGYYGLGKEIIEELLDKVRQLAEHCDALDGFFLTHSLGGGTGSGLTSLLMERLAVDHGRTQAQLLLYPGPKVSPVVVEPYNAVLCAQRALELGSCAVTLDNDVLYDLCRRRLGVELPSYGHLNRLAARVAASLTSWRRQGGAQGAGLSQLQQRLAPYPRLHFPLASLAPLTASSILGPRMTVVDITADCRHPDLQMVKVDACKDKVMKCCFLYRGDVVRSDVSAAIIRLCRRRQISFVDGCPPDIGVSMDARPPPWLPGEELVKVRRSACMLANSLALGEAWRRLGQQCQLLLSRRAFVQHYVGAGLEVEELCQAREDLASLEQDYRELAACSLAQDQDVQEDDDDDDGDDDDDDDAESF